MRTILAGSRSLSRAHLDRALEACQWTSEITSVVSGGARGIDLAGESWAKDHSKPVTRYPADWNRLGMGAGFRRNIKMAKNADALVAVWDGKSRGTQHMISIAQAHGLRVFVFRVQETP